MLKSQNICNSNVALLMGTFWSGSRCSTCCIIRQWHTCGKHTIIVYSKLFCCLCLLSFLIITEIDNSLGILQNCKMTKEMKICDRYIVWLLVQLGAEAHFRNALIVEQILYFTLILRLTLYFVTDYIHNNTPPPQCLPQRLLEYMLAKNI